jgi:lysophospholipase L1-like esterase
MKRTVVFVCGMFLCLLLASWSEGPTDAAVLQGPEIENLLLTSASGYDLTTDDLTCAYTLAGTATTAVTAWYKDGLPVMGLCMPFEGGAANAVKDYSGNGQTATTSGSPVWDATGGRDGRGVYDFDGSDDALIVPDAAALDADYVTLAAWIRLDSYPVDPRVISKEYGTTEPYSIYTLSVGGDGDVGKLQLRVGLVGQDRIIVTGNTVISLSQWTHVAATFDGAEVVLYINGTPDITAPVSGTLRHNDQPVYIGASEFYGRFFDGRIDDARIYPYALSGDQVFALYDDGPNVITASETSVGDQWQARVTPFSDTEAGMTYQTNTLTIQSGAGVVKIMPCGDSITFDNYSGDPRPLGMRTSYRQPLWLMLQAGCYNVDFVGDTLAGQDAYPSFDPDNSGHPGWTDTQVASSIYAWLQAEHADVVLLHIGTNALDTSPADVEDILDEIDRYENDSGMPVTVLLARIINRSTYSATTTQFNDNVEAMALDRVTNPSNPAYPDDIVMVDMEDGAGIDYSADMIDLLHPNHRGYQKMAGLWFEHLEAVLPPPLPSCPSCPLDVTHYWPMDETGGPPYGEYIRASNAACTSCPASASGTVGGALSFDGVANEVNVTDDDVFDWSSTSSFTIEFWMNTSASTSGNRVIVGRDDPGTNLHWWVGPEDAGTVGFQLKDVNNQGPFVGGAGPVLNDGGWHHIVAVRDESTDSNKVYVDAVKVGGAMYDYTAGFGSNVALNLGYLNLSGHYRYQGLVDEVAIYNRALTYAEIAAHHANGLLGIGICGEGTPTAPDIISAPVTTGTVGHLYTYDVDATGYPSPAYALATYPTGMTIDPGTGVIQWTPSTLQAGLNNVSVSATNSEGSDTQDFSIDVSLDGEPVRIMPLGDSITRGAFGSATDVGYRRPLWMLLSTAGCPVDFVGNFQDGTPSDFDRDHNGIDGERDDQVATKVYGYLQSKPADVILLHIGTNALDTNPADVEDILDEIDRYEADYSKSVTVLLARIINRSSYSATTTQFNDNVEAMAVDRMTNPSNPAYPDDIVIVDMEDGAGINYSTDMADAVHPNDAGYTKMADLWYAHLDTLVCGTHAMNVTLTSTSGNDVDTDDLTCDYDLGGSATTAVEAWYLNGSPLMRVCFPMEGGAALSLEDHSGNGFNAITHGNPVWLPNGGHDGNGAWQLDGTGDDLSAGEHFPTNASYTKTAWVYRTGSGANGGNNIISGDQDPNGHALWAPDSYGNKLSAGHNQHWNIVQDTQALALNTWYFVAVSYNSATYEMNLYKNGVLIDTATLSAADRSVTDPTISIGSFGQVIGYLWQGRIDDARVYTRVLSPEQILALYNGQTNVIKSNETVIADQWQARVTPFSDSDKGPMRMSNTVIIQPSTPTAPLIVSTPDTTAVVGVLYSYDVDASGSPLPAYALIDNPAGMTISGSTGLIQWTPSAAGSEFVKLRAFNTEGADTQSYWIEVTEPVLPSVTDLTLTSTSGNNFTTDDLTCGYTLAGGATTAATAWYLGGAPVTPLMQLYLPMEGGATAALNDYSGNGFNAIKHGDAAWISNGGHDGHGAWQFDGTGDDLSAGEHFPTNASYTKTAWVYRTGSGANGGNNIISGDANTGGHAFWAPDMYGNKLSAGHNGTWNSVQDPVALGLNTWYFVALTYNNDTKQMVLYKNGAPVSTATVTVAVTDATISIGSFGLSNGWMWMGRIDDARVWNRALTADQILSLYTNGTNVIESSETQVGDNWQARVTAFSASEAGVTQNSNTVTIVTEVPTPPVITTTPDTTAVVGELYSYDVDATGSPAPAYALIDNPAGMTISGSTGLVEWTASAAGSEFVKLRAFNTEGADTQSYWIEVTEPVVPSVEDLTLTSTSGYNRPDDDLTCGYTLAGGATAAATAWYTGPTGSPLDPLMRLYLPMEGGATAALNDYSGNGFNAIKHGDAAWISDGGHDGHGAWQLDGAGDDLSAGEHFPTLSSYTKSAWVYRTGSGANGGNNVISGDENTGGHALWAPDSYGNKLSGGHNYVWNIVQDTEALGLNTWYFVALTYDRTTHLMTLYKNGVQVDSETVAPADQDVTDPTISIGSFGVTNGFMWQGRIDDARVWNRALTAEQIASLYTTGHDVIVSTETAAGEDWAACVTAFSASEAGMTLCADTLSVSEGGTGITGREVPAEIALHQNVPNPFNPTTTIRYDIHVAGDVSLRVYDVSGRLVKTLVSGAQGAGRQTATWDGTDNAGNRVGSGVYLYQLKTGGTVLTKKMVLLK